MEQKIQELTEKIYREGVEKGEEKARQIAADAEEKAAKIIAEAREQAKKIADDAQKQASELKRNTESEIRLVGNQAIAAVKQQLLDLVGARVVDSAATSALSEPLVMKELVSTIVQNWKMSEGTTPRLEAMLPAHKQDELTKAFEKGASDVLKKGLVLNFSKTIKAGFRIGPADGSFRISLTDDDFKEFFKEYLRPRTRQYLFGE